MEEVYTVSFLKIIFFISLILFSFKGFSSMKKKIVPNQELFHIIDAKDFSTNLNIKIEADFNSVINGKLPIHAISEKKVLLDGGTSFYKGDGYKLTIYKKIITINNTKGFLYGPTFYIGDGDLIGISKIEFYDTKAMSKLLKSEKLRHK